MASAIATARKGFEVLPITDQFNVWVFANPEVIHLAVESALGHLTDNS